MAFTQNRFDNNWVFPNLNLGGKLLSFDGDTLQISALGTTAGRTREALACMSDKAGNLLFYSNNCTIFNKNHEIMEDGEGLNPGQIQTYWCTVNPFANPSDNSILILPAPENDSIFHVFHVDFESFNVGLPPDGTQFAPLHFYHTVVDMSENNGLGKVISKNNLLIEDTLSSCAMQAVRHANGRDWWILMPEYNGNCYYKILLGPSGPQVYDKQCIGSNWGKFALGGGVHFMADGSRYVRCDAEYGLNIFDFDRCSGELSTPANIPIGPQGAFPINCMTLSASGRFAYYHTLSQIYQFDLESLDIPGSKILVATFDGFHSSGNSTDFYKSQLAPDGKIYICTSGPTYYLHVIEYPDSAGLACQVKQHSIELPNRHFAAMPNFPNYRLGALAGVCDTLNVNTQEPQYKSSSSILVYPNPTLGEIHIEHKGGLNIVRTDLLDLTGKTIYMDKQNGNKITIHKKAYNLSPGFYLLKVTDDHGRSEIKKIIVKEY